MSGNGECIANIESAVSVLSETISAPNGLEMLSSMFKTCEPLTDDDDDITNFVSTLASNFQGVVQYNNDNRAFEGAPDVNMTIDVVCGIMNDPSKEPLQRYADVNTLNLNTYGSSCLSFSYEEFVRGMRNESLSSPFVVGGARQWIYQTCAEFGYYQSSDSSSQPWVGFPLSFSVQQCADIYGEEFTEESISNAIDWTRDNYGGYNVSGSNIVFPNGAVDPWHALGVTEDINPSLTAVFMTDTAHCADMYPSRDSDPQDLVDGRVVINSMILEWLSQ